MTQPYVLLAESTETYATSLAEALTSAGVRFVSAATLKEARSMATLEHPTLLVLDLDKPPRESLRLLRDLRASGLVAPVLWVSSQVDAVQMERVQASGAQGLLLKSTDTATTLRAVQTVLEGGVFFDAQQTAHKSSGIRSLTMDDRLHRLLQG